jgi:paraquat-inducible protein B
MRIHHFIIVAGLSAALAAPVAAQSIKSVGDDVHHTLKTAGNAVKGGAKDVGSAAHHTLQQAGNGTKTELGKATGIHKVGGSVGKTARSVSRSGKKVARSARHSLKKSKAHAHADLTKAGKDAKATVKNP